MKKPQQSQYTIKQYTTFHYKIGRKNEEKEFLAGLSKSLINSCVFHIVINISQNKAIINF